MSMESTLAKQQWNGNGSTTTFAFNTYVPSTSDIKLWISSADDDHATGTLQVLNSDYTVSLAALTNYATITMTTAPATGERLTVVLNVGITQPTTFENYSGFPATVVEASFNRITSIAKQLNRRINLAPRAPEWTNLAEANTQTENPEAHGGEFYGIDANGNNVILDDVEGGGGGGTVGNVLFGSVVDVLPADSPYTPDEDDDGAMLRCAPSGSTDLSIVLPDLDSMTSDVRWAVVKDSGADGDVVVTASGGQLINGASSHTIRTRWKIVIFVGDKDNSKWTTMNIGASPASVKVDYFDGDGSTVAFTLSEEPSVEENTWVDVGGIVQHTDTYAVSGTTLTFSEAPPSGTDNIMVRYLQSESIGTPSDGTVTDDSFAPVSDGYILIGDGTGANFVAMSGDATIDNAGVVTVNATAAGAATRELDNLTTVAINTTIASDTDNTDDLGSQTIRWRNAYLRTLRAGSTATDSLEIQALDTDTGPTWTTFFTVQSNPTPTGVLSGNVTSTTQSAADNSTKLATTAYVDTLADGRIKVGNVSNVGTAVVPSGDVTMDNAGVFTIANNAITNAKMADDAVDSAEIADGAVDTIHIADNNVTAAKLALVLNGTVQTISSSANAITVDLASGNVVKTTLTENITSMTISNIASAVFGFDWMITQDSSARTIVWDTDILWADNVDPDLSTVSIDYFFHFRRSPKDTSKLIGTMVPNPS